MKTAREWFQCLRPDLRDKAIENTISLNYDYYKFTDALQSSFRWMGTPEGYEFWSKIHKEARDIEHGIKPDIKPKKSLK